MKKIQILILAVVAMFAFSAIVASAAFAEEKPLWLVMGEDVPTGGVTINITVSGKLLLEDMSATGGAVNVECEGAGLGLLLPEGLGTQNSVTSEKCVVGSTKGACESVVEMQSVNLPWMTELLQLFGVYEDDIVAGTGGNPGWLVECKTILGNVDDTCTTAAGKTLLSEETSGEVNSEFMESVAESEWASCTQGTAHSGLVVGLVLIHVLLPGNELMTLTLSLP